MKKQLEDLNKAYEKAGQSRELTNRYKLIIKSVDENTTWRYRWLRKRSLWRDSSRDYVNDINPDIDFDTKVKCLIEYEVTVPMTLRFFWPNAPIEKALWTNINWLLSSFFISSVRDLRYAWMETMAISGAMKEEQEQAKKVHLSITENDKT